MAFFEYTLEKTPINKRIQCPECSALIDLALIESEKLGFDLRTFECQKCQHVETVVIKFR